MPKSLMSVLLSWSRERLEESRAAEEMHYATKLGVLGIMKNEAINLDEWVEHYLWMGAGKIYLIDNGSTDDTVAKAKAWVAKGHVQLVEYPARHQQVQHYRTAFRHFGIARQCEWVLVADLDEFWFCPAGDSLAHALEEFDQYDVIYSNWVMFGSGGLIEHPDSVREGFTLRREGVAGHNETKYICRSRVLEKPSALGIHKVRGGDSMRTVSDTQRFQLNHYPIQSEAFFRAVKMTRGASDTASSDFIRDMDYFRRYDQGCDHQDRQLADLAAAAGKR
jgi:hypothetical protein